MEMNIITYKSNDCLKAIIQRIKELDLMYYASDLHYGTMMQSKICHAMKLFAMSGLEIETNFKRIFKYSSGGIHIDWKFSNESCKNDPVLGVCAGSNSVWLPAKRNIRRFHF